MMSYAPVTVNGVGGEGWIPVPGDYDGDGIANPIIYSRTGAWYIRFSASEYTMGGPYVL